MPQDGPIHSASLKPAVKDVASWCFQILKLLSDFPGEANPESSDGERLSCTSAASVEFGRRCYGNLQIQHDPKLYNILKHINLQ